MKFKSISATFCLVIMLGLLIACKFNNYNRLNSIDSYLDNNGDNMSRGSYSESYISSSNDSFTSGEHIKDFSESLNGSKGISSIPGIHYKSGSLYASGNVDSVYSSTGRNSYDVSLCKNPEQIGTHSIASSLVKKGVTLPYPSKNKLPDWRGFNLLNKFNYQYPTEFSESDFKTIHEFGFNFVRVPIDYRGFVFNYTSYEHILTQQIFDIDRAIEYGIKYNIHVNLCFITAPGHSFDNNDDGLSLFRDIKAQDLTVRYWQMFARRYAGIPSNVLSFNLLNEPDWDVDSIEYSHLMQRIIDAIKIIDINRFLIIDGGYLASVPLNEIAGQANVAQSLHNYAPIELTHYKAPWVYWDDVSVVPKWPFIMSQSPGYVCKDWILANIFDKWVEFNKTTRSAYMVGEFGVFNKTPHDVTLAYLKESLEAFKELGIPWALWNFKGEFGIVDSNRTDVKYEKYNNYSLDREMLELLQKYQ